MKVLCTHSPTGALDFITISWAAQSTNINIALAVPCWYNICIIHMPMSGYMYICPDGHEVRKTDCKQARRKLEDCGFVFYFSHQGALETSTV